MSQISKLNNSFQELKGDIKNVNKKLSEIGTKVQEDSKKLNEIGTKFEMHVKYFPLQTTGIVCGALLGGTSLLTAIGWGFQLKPIERSEEHTSELQSH